MSFHVHELLTFSNILMGELKGNTDMLQLLLTLQNDMRKKKSIKVNIQYFVFDTCNEQ